MESMIYLQALAENKDFYTTQSNENEVILFLISLITISQM